MIVFWFFWNFFALVMGAMEARIHHWRGSDIGNDKWIHSFYLSLRASVWAGYCFDVWREHGLNYAMLFTAACAMSFPFLHSGMQFTVRRMLSKRVDYHWFSTSTTTNAKINIDGATRTFMFAISIIIILWINSYSNFETSTKTIFA